jgi:hypothetical protein
MYVARAGTVVVRSLLSDRAPVNASFGVCSTTSPAHSAAAGARVVTAAVAAAAAAAATAATAAAGHATTAPVQNLRWVSTATTVGAIMATSRHHRPLRLEAPRRSCCDLRSWTCLARGWCRARAATAWRSTRKSSSCATSRARPPSSASAARRARRRRAGPSRTMRRAPCVGNCWHHPGGIQEGAPHA